MEQVFHITYPLGERIFNHIGLLQEPIGKANIAKHLTVIQSLNQYITEAWYNREDTMEEDQRMADLWALEFLGTV